MQNYKKNSTFAPQFNGGLAHLVEHLVRNQKVVGSSPITSTPYGM